MLNGTVGVDGDFEWGEVRLVGRVDGGGLYENVSNFGRRGCSSL